MDSHMKHYEGHFVFWAVVIFLATYLILTFYNPEFVQRKDNKDRATGVNDQAVTMIWAFGILLAIVLVLALLWYAFSCAW